MRLTVLLLVATMLSGPVVAQSAGGIDAKPNQAPQAQSISPNTTIRMFQPLGGFPTNTITNRPFVGPLQGNEGYKKTVVALQKTLTDLQQLQIQLKQSHWNVSGTLFYPLRLLS